MQPVLRIDLVSHGLTDALRTARFPDDEPLTTAGRRKVTAAGLLSRLSTGNTQIYLTGLAASTVLLTVVVVVLS